MREPKGKMGSKFADMLPQFGALWKVGGKKSGCVLRTEEWSNQELFSGPEESYPCDCVRSCGVQRDLVARQDQSFVLILWAESRQTEEDRTSRPLYQDLIYFPKQFSVFMRLPKCGGSKITVINWNSECASMALLIWRSSISLMSM